MIIDSARSLRNMGPAGDFFGVIASFSIGRLVSTRTNAPPRGAHIFMSRDSVAPAKRATGQIVSIVTHALVNMDLSAEIRRKIVLSDTFNQEISRSFLPRLGQLESVLLIVSH